MFKDHNGMKDIFEIASKKSKKPIPFSFVLELLEKADPITKPMFGCTAIYVGIKIVLILRDKIDYEDDNGIWVATTEEHRASLKKDFPSLRSIRMFGDKTTGWQNLPVKTKDFEEAATLLCELILKNDPRIGKIPKPRYKSKSKPRARKKKTSKK